MEDERTSVVGEETIEPTEGVADPKEKVSEEANAETKAEPEIPNEVWKTARLKAEKEANEKAQARIDSFYAEMYADFGIKNEEDYKKYMANQETQLRDERLQGAGISHDDIIGIINEMPEMETLRNYKAAQEAKFQEEALDYCIKEIQKLDPSIKTLEDLNNHPNAEAFEALVSKGYSLQDAFKLANFDTLSEQRAAKAQQEIIKKISQNGVASPGSLTGGAEAGTVDIDKLTPEEFENYIKRAKRGEFCQS